MSHQRVEWAAGWHASGMRPAGSAASPENASPCEIRFTSSMTRTPAPCAPSAHSLVRVSGFFAQVVGDVGGILNIPHWVQICGCGHGPSARWVRAALSIPCNRDTFGRPLFPVRLPDSWPTGALRPLVATQLASAAVAVPGAMLPPMRPAAVVRAITAVAVAVDAGAIDRHSAAVVADSCARSASASARASSGSRTSCENRFSALGLRVTCRPRSLLPRPAEYARLRLRKRSFYAGLRARTDFRR